MRTHTTARLLTAALVLSGAAVGCGAKTPEGVVDPDPAEAQARARVVAEAWDGSRAAEEWRAGYHPMAEAAQLPEGGLRAGGDERAWETQNIRLRGDLPAERPQDGRVEWERGSSLDRPLTGAREAYETVARGGNPGPALTVTGAKLGEMTLATSRGPATVPAWLFTLEGYDTPLRRAAVVPSQLPAPPVEPARGRPSLLEGLVETAADGRSVTVRTGHGACDDGPVVDVLETGGSVVLTASVAGGTDGPCTAQLLREEVTVTLDRPLGDRVLLDASTGRPVPYGQPEGPSPSWS